MNILQRKGLFSVFGCFLHRFYSSGCKQKVFETNGYRTTVTALEPPTYLVTLTSVYGITISVFL